MPSNKDEFAREVRERQRLDALQRNVYLGLGIVIVVGSLAYGLYLILSAEVKRAASPEPVQQKVEESAQRLKPLFMNIFLTEERASVQQFHSAMEKRFAVSVPLVRPIDGELVERPLEEVEMFAATVPCTRLSRNPDLSFEIAPLEEIRKQFLVLTEEVREIEEVQCFSLKYEIQRPIIEREDGTRTFSLLIGADNVLSFPKKIRLSIAEELAAGSEPLISHSFWRRGFQSEGAEPLSEVAEELTSRRGVRSYTLTLSHPEFEEGDVYQLLVRLP